MPVDNTSPASVTPLACRASGYQQGAQEGAGHARLQAAAAGAGPSAPAPAAMNVPNAARKKAVRVIAESLGWPTREIVPDRLLQNKIFKPDKIYKPESSGQNAKLGLAEGPGGMVGRLGSALGGSLKTGPQIGAALLHLVAQFAAREGGEGRITQLLPGGPKPLLQCAYLLIEDFWLCHSGGISKRDRIAINADSRSNAYPPKIAGFQAGTSALHDRWMCGLGAFQCPAIQRLFSPCCLPA